MRRRKAAMERLLQRKEERQKYQMVRTSTCPLRSVLTVCILIYAYPLSNELIIHFVLVAEAQGGAAVEAAGEAAARARAAGGGRSAEGVAE